jgi:hypothetical protein
MTNENIITITFITFIAIIIIYLINNKGKPFRPIRGKWYRNKKTKIRIIESIIPGTVKTVGWETRYKNCYIKFNGRWRRGSFKRKKNKILFILGWKYSKKKINTADLNDCKFFKGGSRENRTYRLVIKTKHKK